MRSSSVLFLSVLKTLMIIMNCKNVLRLLVMLSVAGLTIGASHAVSEQFTEGQHYQRITPSVPTAVDSDKVEVVELFWYGCPHCYTLEPYIDQWLTVKPNTAEFERLPATLNPSWTNHARTFYALELLGELERVHPLLFQAIHDQRRRLKDLQSIARFVAQQGVDQGKFIEAFKSLPVQTKVNRASQLSRAYGLDGVPAVVVNGRYRTTASMAGGYGSMLEVIDYLVDKESNTSK